MILPLMGLYWLFIIDSKMSVSFVDSILNVTRPPTTDVTGRPLLSVFRLNSICESITYISFPRMLTVALNALILLYIYWL